MHHFGTFTILRPEQIAAGYPLHAVLQHRHVEIDQQPQRLLVELQLCQQLRFVNRVQFRHRFEFQSTANLLLTNFWSPVSPSASIVDGQNTITNTIGAGPQFYRLKKLWGQTKVFKVNMTEIKLKKGEPVEKALRRFKKKLDREQTLQQVRLHRRFEKPSAKKRRKTKAARFAAMLKERYAEF